MGLKYTLATLALATALIGLKSAGDNRIKVGNTSETQRVAEKVSGPSSRMAH